MKRSHHNRHPMSKHPTNVNIDMVPLVYSEVYNYYRNKDYNSKLLTYNSYYDFNPPDSLMKEYYYIQNRIIFGDSSNLFNQAYSGILEHYWEVRLSQLNK